MAGNGGGGGMNGTVAATKGFKNSTKGKIM
jgi:hypothetical protein